MYDYYTYKESTKSTTITPQAIPEKVQLQRISIRQSG